MMAIPVVSFSCSMKLFAFVQCEGKVHQDLVCLSVRYNEKLFCSVLVTCVLVSTIGLWSLLSASVLYSYGAVPDVKRG